MVVLNSKIKLLKVKGSEKLKMQQLTSLEAKLDSSRRRRGSSAENMRMKGYQKDDFVWVTTNRLLIEGRRDTSSSPVNKESSPNETMNLTIISHNKGREESHKQNEKIAKEVRLKRMSKEEIDIEVAKIKIELGNLEKLTQNGIREGWKQGTYVGKRGKWTMRELFAEELIPRTVENERIESICE